MRRPEIEGAQNREVHLPAARVTIGAAAYTGAPHSPGQTRAQGPDTDPLLAGLGGRYWLDSDGSLAWDASLSYCKDLSCVMYILYVVRIQSRDRATLTGCEVLKHAVWSDASCGAVAPHE